MWMTLIRLKKKEPKVSTVLLCFISLYQHVSIDTKYTKIVSPSGGTEIVVRLN